MGIEADREFNRKKTLLSRESLGDREISPAPICVTALEFFRSCARLESMSTTELLDGV